MEQKENPKVSDAFLSAAQKVLIWLAPYNRVIVTVAVAVIVASGLTVGCEAYKQSQEEKSAERIFQVMNPLREKQQEVEESLLPKELPQDKRPGKKDKKDKKIKETPPTTAQKTPELLNQKLSQVIEGAKTVVEKENSQSAYAAAMEISSLYREYGDLKGAKKVLEGVLPRLQPDDFFFGLVHLQIAGLLSDLSENDLALEHCEKVLQAKQQAYLFPEALIKKGVILQKQKKFSEAQKMYQRVLDEHSDTPAGESAQVYLRLLALQARGSGG